jgi:hypothetical protein
LRIIDGAVSIDVELKSDRLVYALCRLTDEEIEAELAGEVEVNV